MPETVNNLNLPLIPISISKIDINHETTIKDNGIKNSQLASSELEKKVHIKIEGILYFIAIFEIIMIEAESNYSKILLSDGRKIMTSKTLKYWSNKVNGTPFVRVHRSYLVNKNHVLSIHLNQKLLILSNGESIGLSRRNFKDKVDSMTNV